MTNILPFPEPGRGNSVQATAINSVEAALPEADDNLRWGGWMAGAQAGDRAAYHRLLQDIVPYLRALSRRLLGNDSDADDVVQEILILVHEIRHTYEPQRPFKPWLKTIATRRCIDQLRRRSRRLRHEVAQDGDWSELQGHDATPEQQLERGQHQRALGAAVGQQPARQREAIRLLRLGELSLAEAAAQSEQSIGSLKVACHRALKSLHRALAGKEPT
jgi:RNA polymerase sigma-70 factor (ECF subfamily)